MQQPHPELLQPGRQNGGVARHALTDAAQPLRPMIDRVHAGHHGWQHLRGANVGCGFFAPDVLLARLQRQPVGALAMRIHAHPHQAAGQGALEGVAAGQKSGVWAARAHGHTEALAAAKNDVGAHCAGFFEHGQGQQVGSQQQRRALGVDGVGAGLPVGQPAAAAGVLVEGGKVVVLLQRGLPFLGRVQQLHAQAERRGAGLQHLDGLWVAIGADQNRVSTGLDRALGQRHGFGGGGGFVEHGGVGDVHTGQVADQGLEVDQRLHAALRNLGLIGGVGGVPGRVFQDVAQNHARRVGAVIALPDEAAQHLVLLRDGLEFGQRRRLAHGRWQLHGLRAHDAGRHDGLDQGAARLGPDGAQHLRLIGGAGADVAGMELGGGFEFAQGGLGRVGHIASGPQRG